jgi:hypothetical protein
LYTEKLLHTDEHFYTQALLHTNTFTHRDRTREIAILPQFFGVKKRKFRIQKKNINLKKNSPEIFGKFRIQNIQEIQKNQKLYKIKNKESIKIRKSKKHRIQKNQKMQKK